MSLFMRIFGFIAVLLGLIYSVKAQVATEGESVLDILRRPAQEATQTKAESGKNDKKINENKKSANKNTDKKAQIQQSNSDASMNVVDKGVSQGKRVLLDGQTADAPIGNEKGVQIKLNIPDNSKNNTKKQEKKVEQSEIKEEKSSEHENTSDKNQQIINAVSQAAIEDLENAQKNAKSDEDSKEQEDIHSKNTMPNVNLEFPTVNFDAPQFDPEDAEQETDQYNRRTNQDYTNKQDNQDYKVSQLNNDEKIILEKWDDSVPAAINEMIKKHGVRKEDFSLIIQDVTKEKPLAVLNPDELRSPASATKLMTTAAGLIAMGGDFTYPTRFYVDKMPNSQGVVDGNLYIQGGGDPFLVEERLADMVKALREKGIRHISGNIILDNSLYYLPAQARNTEIFDGNKWSAYNAIPSPLMVNFRTIQIRFAPSGKNDVKISLHPNIVNWKIENKLTINSAKCDANNFSPTPDLERDEKGYAIIKITGKYSTACGNSDISVVMGEAVEQFYYLFHDLWYATGATFDGGGVIGQVPAEAKLFYTGESLPLSELINKMNTLSNNVMTRQLMLTLGAYVHGIPGNLEKGRLAINETLSAFGVPLDGAIIDNGSGLSRETRLSARSFIVLLVNMYRSEKLRDDFMQSMAIAGQTGTMKKRFAGTNKAGKIIGKTGTIDQTRAFAGYVKATSGHTYAVVMIGNGKTAVASRYLQDDVLSWIYEQ